jgi:hypothetical protein
VDEPALLELWVLSVVEFGLIVHAVTPRAMSRSSGTTCTQRLSGRAEKRPYLNSGNDAEKDAGEQAQGRCRSGDCIGKISFPVIVKGGVLHHQEDITYPQLLTDKV